MKCAGIVHGGLLLFTTDLTMNLRILGLSGTVHFALSQQASCTHRPQPNLQTEVQNKLKSMAVQKNIAGRRW
jgi:hypothetical protein